MVQTLKLPLVLSALVLSGCQFFFPTPIDQAAESQAPSQTVRTVGSTYEEGETFDVEILLDAVAAGEGTLTTGRRCLADGKLGLPVSVEAKSAGLVKLFGDASIETFGLIDVDTNAPLESHWDVTFGEKRTLAELDYGVGTYRLNHTRFEEDKPPKTQHRVVELPIEQIPHDGLSFVGYLRRWDPAPGTRGYLYVLFGRNLYRADLLFVGPEVITTRNGPELAVRIDGVATRTLEATLKESTRVPQRPFTFWVSRDTSRRPLRILIESELAKFTLEVTSHAKDAPSADEPEACAKRVDKKELAKARAPKKRKPGAPDDGRSKKPARGIPGMPDADGVPTLPSRQK